MSSFHLPSALLDLTMVRVSLMASRAVSIRHRFTLTRHLHVTGANTLGSPPFEEYLQSAEDVLRKRRGRKRPSLGGLAVRSKQASTPLQELEDKIQALQEVAEAEEASTEEPFYSERNLSAFYQDVLASAYEDDSFKVNEQVLRQALLAEDVVVLNAMYERFELGADVPKPYRTVLSRLGSIVSRLEAAQRITAAESANAEQQLFPVSILTMRECEALVRACTKGKDPQAAELTLDLMKRTGLSIPTSAITDILQLYSKTGDATAADQLLAKFLTEPPSDIQRHLHISSHLKTAPPTSIPTSALDALHSYETKALAAPMKTYTAAITSLFSVPSSTARAQAWDLFSHMRYVAHPDPDVLLYTLMIRACASPISSTLSSEPERALDLWTEMTIDHGLSPTVGAYNAVILACARAGTKEFVSEAFRIARQMLDSNRDAEGRSAFRPDQKTFCALLEGAKRVGDLGRVRWILAEIVGNKGHEGDVNGPVDVKVDEEVMLHVFNAYAAYRPPFQRGKTLVVEDGQQAQQASQETAAPSSSTEIDNISHPTEQPSPSVESDRQIILGDDDPPSFFHLPPQSHAEVLHEAKFLFDCIRNTHASNNPAPPFADQKFKNVKLTTRLINAYLSIYFKHASLATSRDLFWRLYNEVGLTRSARTYVEALERCGNTRKGHERPMALQFADELWAQWQSIEAAGELDGRKLDARMIERANVAMIRVLTLTSNMDRAMDVIRAFASRYDPRAVRVPPQKPTMRSSRTVLVALRPLVRSTSATDVPDDQVPPLMTFKDIEILHHRLVAYGRYKDIGYLKWLCKAYEWALRVRRDETTKMVPKQLGQTPVVIV